jgi:hypothetical protein
MYGREVSAVPVHSSPVYEAAGVGLTGIPYKEGLMRTIRGFGVLLCFALLAITLGLESNAAQQAAQLKAGDPAPPFLLQGSDGKSYRLADFRGKQAVVLVWFVKAFSAG